jgi:prepilin-type N-terminal cleavage/methylation domain-containing protein
MLYRLRRRSKDEGGFTLIELLVVILIIGIRNCSGRSGLDRQGSCLTWAGFSAFAWSFALVAGAGKVAGRASYAELEALVAKLEARIAEQDRVIAELRERLDQNSRNSSKPPSLDGYAKPAVKSRSLRRRSERKPGGQEGHEGAYLVRVELPDGEVLNEPEACDGCGSVLKGAERVEDGEESRQVFDLPEEITLRVIAHVAVNRLCGGCRQISTCSFPAGVDAPAQYGPEMRALGVYLHVFQHIPYDRARQLMFEMTGSELSTGTLKAWVDRAAAGLADFDDELLRHLKKSPVVHFDETGARIAGRLGWVHSASTETLTRYSSHAGRGVVAMDAAGGLTDLRRRGRA